MKICHPRLHYGHYGFTIVELVTAVTILGILTLVGLYYLQDLGPQNRRSNYITRLNTNLFSARAYAIYNNHNITVCPSVNEQCVTNWQNDIMVFIDLDNNQNRSIDEQILRILEMPSAGDTISYPRNALTFRPTGALAGFQSGSFIYCSVDTKLNKPAKRIVVSQAGRLRVKLDSNKC